MAKRSKDTSFPNKLFATIVNPLSVDCYISAYPTVEELYDACGEGKSIAVVEYRKVSKPVQASRKIVLKA